MEGCDLKIIEQMNTNMAEKSFSIPEEFVDTLVNEFTYDPIRLPLRDDPAQVLYNRRTLEKIWDTKHSAVDPYTRQPFDISYAIPQIELRQQMRQYIENNQSLCKSLGVTVISDYTKMLSKREMKDFLKKLISNFECLVHISHLGKRNMPLHLLPCWNALWQDFNLLRLYCQYREENRELFLSIRGYEYLFEVINGSLIHLLRKYYNNAMEVCTEVVKIVDVIGLEDHHLQTAPEDSVRAFMCILYDVAQNEHSKIQTRVLKIYWGSIDYILQSVNSSFFFIIDVTLDLLARRQSYISNEDLYYGTTILKAAWIKNYRHVLVFEYYVDAIVDAVIICVSRFKEMHAIAVAHRGSSKRPRRHEVKKNIILKTALGHGLFLIDCLITADDEDAQFLIQPKERLRSLDIVKDILQMVELVLGGFKFLESSHLRLGLNITTTLYINGGLSVMRRNEVVKSLGAFLRSDKVDMFDYNVKLLLDDIVRHAEADSS